MLRQYSAMKAGTEAVYLTLNKKIAVELRMRALQKYGNTRSFSRYVEDLTKETRGKD